MTPRQRERLNIYQQVIRNYDESSVSEPLPQILQRYFEAYRLAVSSILCMDYLVECSRKDCAPPPDDLFVFLEPLAVAAGRNLLNSATDRELDSLARKTDYALGHISASSRDIRSAALVTISEELEANLQSLKIYGVDESVLTSFQISVENYLGIVPSISHVLPDPDSYQVGFGNVLHCAKVILRDKIDRMIEELAERYQRFYQSYRRIRTYGEINYLL